MTYKDEIAEAVLCSINNADYSDERLRLMFEDLNSDIGEGEVSKHDSFIANTATQAALTKMQEIALRDEVVNMVAKVVYEVIKHGDEEHRAWLLEHSAMATRPAINKLFQQLGGE